MTDTTKYGPQTAEIVALLARARTLTSAEVRALDAPRDAVRGAALAAVKAAAWGAVRGAAWDEARYSAWGTAWYAGRSVTWDAVLALVVRDLITPGVFTQAQYDLLTGPWRRVVGKVHPDDVVMK